MALLHRFTQSKKFFDVLMHLCEELLGLFKIYCVEYLFVLEARKSVVYIWVTGWCGPFLIFSGFMLLIKDFQTKIFNMLKQNLNSVILWTLLWLFRTSLLFLLLFLFCPIIVCLFLLILFNFTFSLRLLFLCFIFTKNSSKLFLIKWEHHCDHNSLN